MPFYDKPHTRPPIALIVTGQEWVSLSIESLFSARGYAVLRAFTPAHAFQRIRDSRPDLLVVDKDLRELRGVDLIRRVRAMGAPWAAVPSLLIAIEPWTRDGRLEALRAGAWDTCSLPTDSEELFLRVDTWVRSKLEADEAREQGLYDAATGLYNAQGLLRRVAEIAAAASRRRAPLACVVIATEPDSNAPERPEPRSGAWTHSFASRLRAAGRASDTMGHLSETEFVVLAPDTDGAGAAVLAQRLKAVAESGIDTDSPPVQLRVGCYAVPDFRDASIAPTELLIRAAEAALRQPAADSVAFFSPTPTRN